MQAVKSNADFLVDSIEFMTYNTSLEAAKCVTEGAKRRGIYKEWLAEFAAMKAYYKAKEVI